jgi:hydroxypyruvate isomerase
MVAVMSAFISRRNAIAKIACGMTASAALPTFLAAATSKNAEMGDVRTMSKTSLLELCKTAVSLGLPSVELQGPNAWPTLKEFGLTCGLGTGADLGPKLGFSQIEQHKKLVANYREIIPLAAKAGLSNLICYSGARGKLKLEEALTNSESGIKPLLKLAEKHKVTLVMELTNNDVNSNHYDPEFTTQYSRLSHHIGSDHFKILQEVYQLQTIPQTAMLALRKYHPFLGCYYPAGLPKQPEFAKSISASGSDQLIQYNRALKLTA